MIMEILRNIQKQSRARILLAGNKLLCGKLAKRPVFTYYTKQHLISYNGRHLTHEGAKFAALKLKKTCSRFFKEVFSE